MKLLITGSLSLSNKGTAAIVISAIEELKKMYPDAEIFVELAFPERQRTIMQIEEKKVKIIKPLFQDTIKGCFLFLAAFVYYIFSKFGLRFNKLIPKSLALYREVDVVIDLSAEGFVKWYDDKSEVYVGRFLMHIYPVLIALFLEKPVVILAQTMAPFGMFRPVMKFIFKNVKAVTLRDASSVTNLEKEGIDTSKMQVTADPAFLLKESSEQEVKKLLEKENINIAEKKSQGKKVVGVCCGKFLHGSEDIIKEMADAINDIISEYNAEVIFIPHSSGKITAKKDDVIAGLEMERHIIKKENFFVIKGDYTPQELKGVIGSLDLLVSLRMHPVIFAFSMGVPSVIIAFNDKAYGLTQKFDMEDCVLDVRNIDKDVISGKVKNIFCNYSIEKNKLISKIIIVREQALENFKVVGTLLQ